MPTAFDEDEMSVEALTTYIQELSTDDFHRLNRWIHDIEKKRRFKIYITERDKEHIKKIKSLRLGHKLVFTRNMSSHDAGTIVKLYNKKGKRTRIDIKDNKGKVWDVPISCVGDAEDVEAMRNANATKQFSRLFG